MRIIVSGSRDWEGDWARATIRDTLNASYILATVIGQDEPFTVIHGACPTGADQIADEWAAQSNQFTVERYPADWERLGKRAGPLRNQQMIAKGADMVFGFRRNNSTGTGHLLSLARNAGILTYEIPWNPPRRSSDTTMAP